MRKRNKTLTRREFFSRTVSGMASVGFLGVSMKSDKSSESDTSVKDSDKKIIYRTLGETGIQVPVVSMGVMNSNESVLIGKAYEKGIRLFDTAYNYQRGRNEEIVGSVIKDLNIRDEVIIATKIPNPGRRRKLSVEETKERFLEMTEESLKRLKTDYVDILYYHSIRKLEDLNNPGVHEALLLLKEQKKVRFIGFSTHTNMIKLINNAVATGFYEVILTAFNYAMCDDKSLIDAVKNAASRGIGVIAMKTQCNQEWYRKYVPEKGQKYYEGSIINPAVLKWVLRNEFITTAIPGFTTFQQLDEDIAAAYNLEYTPEEKKFLKDRNVKLSLGYCRQCDQCITNCPHSVDIPSLMRTHMYAACYSNFYQARDTLDSIPEEKGLQVCVSCEKCSARCEHSIDIRSRIEELKTIYV